MLQLFPSSSCLYFKWWFMHELLVLKTNCLFVSFFLLLVKCLMEPFQRKLLGHFILMRKCIADDTSSGLEVAYISFLGRRYLISVCIVVYVILPGFWVKCQCWAKMQNSSSLVKPALFQRQDQRINDTWFKVPLIQEVRQIKRAINLMLLSKKLFDQFLGLLWKNHYAVRIN